MSERKPCLPPFPHKTSRIRSFYAHTPMHPRRIHFDDLHHTGLFTWELLQDLGQHKVRQGRPWASTLGAMNGAGLSDPASDARVQGRAHPLSSHALPQSVYHPWALQHLLFERALFLTACLFCPLPPTPTLRNISTLQLSCARTYLRQLRQQGLSREPRSSSQPRSPQQPQR